MAKPRKPEKALLLTGVIYSNEKALDEVKKMLIKKFGKIWIESEPYDFTKFTQYYEPEMGKRLFKKNIVFKKFFTINKLPDIKLYTNKLEDKFSKKNGRIINLDPGYMTITKLILASVKDRKHKVYLDKGIYADLTYVFLKESCIIFRHTFPDFKTERVQKFFLEVRNKLKERL